MSSTYSPDLRIQLIGTGDQAGTWGNTTNTNLGGVIENAIAGVQSISVTSSAQALTYLYGAVDQSQGAVLVLTTTTTAPFAIYTPTSATKQYTVVNTTSYTATIYVSSVLGNTTNAGTGVSIPANSTATVWTDGTNFYSQNSYLPGNIAVGTNLAVGGTLGVTGNTTLSGTLAVTGTTTYTGAVTLSGGGTTTTPTTGDNSTKIATTAFVQSAAISLATIYPVGSIYMNTSSSTNPATLFGFGTWTALAPGQMLLGNGGGYTAGATGGSATTTISLSNLPPHDHSITDPGHLHAIRAYPNASSSGGGGLDVGASGNYNTNSATTGISVNTTQKSGSAFPNTAMTTISPYLVVYMWQRTA